MPRATIEQIVGLGDFATTYQWNMTFVSFPAVLNGGVIPASEDLNLRMLSTTVPIKGNTDQEVKIRGHVVSQSGQAEYNKELVLTFYETVDVIVSNFLLAWQETCVQTLTGKHGSNDQSKCNIQLQQLDRQDEPIWLYSIHGCRLKTYAKTDLSSEDAMLQPSLTIRYDYFTEQAI